MDTYLLEYLVSHPRATAGAMRQQLRKSLPWAHELLVVSDRDLVKVHVRTGRPDIALAIGLACGALTDIVLQAGPRVDLDHERTAECSRSAGTPLSMPHAS